MTHSYVTRSFKTSDHRFHSLVLSILSVSILLVLPWETQAQVKLGADAPVFSLKDQTGQTHALKSYRGKTVVLEWTNPGCPFVEYHYKKDTMTKLSASHPNVVWLTINSSHFTTEKENQKWSKMEGVKTVLADPSGEVGRQYGARTTPHMFVINASGQLVYQGAIDDNPHMDEKNTLNYVDEALKNLAANQKVKVAETKPYGCSVKYKR
jgi:peroxiredoxin